MEINKILEVNGWEKLDERLSIKQTNKAVLLMEINSLDVVIILDNEFKLVCDALKQISERKRGIAIEEWIEIQKEKEKVQK